MEDIMLKTALYLGLGLAVVIAGVIAYAATRPNTFKVARSIGISAPPEVVFPLISNLRKFATWSPYETKDPDMKRTFSGAESGAGQRYDWEGNSNVGKGWLFVAGTFEPSQVDIDLNMLKPIHATNRVTFTLVPDGRTTNVTWAMQGHVPLLAKVLHLFVDMDRMCGDDFEVGLASLKTLAEGSPVAAVQH
jgi:hypothetical protein